MNMFFKEKPIKKKHLDSPLKVKVFFRTMSPLSPEKSIQEQLNQKECLTGNLDICEDSSPDRLINTFFKRG
jgi:hypothetical protein